MRILHVGESIRGGIATYFHSTIPAQVQNYGETEVFGIAPSCFFQDIAGVFPNLRAARWRGRSASSLFRYFLSVRAAIRDIKPTLVHAHSTFAGVAVRLAVALIPQRKRPLVIYSSHGWSFSQEIPEIKRRCYAFVERLLLFWTDGVIHISNDEARRAHSYGLRPRAEAIIYNGLPKLSMEHAVKPESNSLRLLFVGRLDRQKGFDILLEALQNVRRTDVMVKVAGSAVLRERAGKVLPLAKRDGRIQMLGWLDQDLLIELYREADVVVIPSRWDGFCFVAIEAMRQGIAVFASRRGALPEIVVEGVTGELFDPYQPLQLARLIDQATPEKMRDLGRKGYRRFEEKFGADVCSTALMDFYDHCLLRETPAG